MRVRLGVTCNPSDFSSDDLRLTFRYRDSISIIYQIKFNIFRYYFQIMHDDYIIRFMLRQLQIRSNTYQIKQFNLDCFRCIKILKSIHELPQLSFTYHSRDNPLSTTQPIAHVYPQPYYLRPIGPVLHETKENFLCAASSVKNPMQSVPLYIIGPSSYRFSTHI